MHLESEGGKEWCQSQHETTDHRCKPRIATTTRADDQRCWATGNRGAQRPSPYWNIYPIVTLGDYQSATARFSRAQEFLNTRPQLYMAFTFREKWRTFYSFSLAGRTTNEPGEPSSFADWFAPNANEKRTQNRPSLGFHRYSTAGSAKRVKIIFTCFSFPSIFAFGPRNRARRTRIHSIPGNRVEETNIFESLLHNRACFKLWNFFKENCTSPPIFFLERYKL
jgi:hypothetical protein